MDNPSEESEEIVVHLDPLIASIVDDFLLHRKEDAAAILAALETSDLETIDQIGHDLEGTAGAFGFSGMADLGNLLQKAAKESSSDEIKRLVGELFSYLDRLRVVYGE